MPSTIDTKPYFLASTADNGSSPEVDAADVVAKKVEHFRDNGRPNKKDWPEITDAFGTENASADRVKTVSPAARTAAR
eukprot:scaffold23396_cov47-Attheya_sp.AAC.4